MTIELLSPLVVKFFHFWAKILRLTLRLVVTILILAPGVCLADNRDRSQAQQPSMDQQLARYYLEVEKSIEALSVKLQSLLEKNNSLRRRVLELHSNDNEEIDLNKNAVNGLMANAQNLRLVQNDLNAEIEKLRENDSNLSENIEKVSKNITDLRQKSRSVEPIAAVAPAKPPSTKINVRELNSLMNKLNDLNEHLQKTQRDVAILSKQKTDLLSEKSALDQKRVKGVSSFDQEIQDLNARGDALSRQLSQSQPPKIPEKQKPTPDPRIERKKTELQKKINFLRKENAGLEEKTLRLMKQVVSLDRQKSKLNEK